MLQENVKNHAQKVNGTKSLAKAIYLGRVLQDKNEKLQIGYFFKVELIFLRYLEMGWTKFEVEFRFGILEMVN